MKAEVQRAGPVNMSWNLSDKLWWTRVLSQRSSSIHMVASCDKKQGLVMNSSYACQFSDLNTFLYFSIAERKAPDSISTDLVNGDHLSIPGMHDYAYGSLGTYNQMSPSPKSVAPQSPSSAPRSYTLGEQTQLTAVWEPLHLNISMYILLTLLYKFPLVLSGRICLSIKIFSLWSFPLFSRPYCVI